MSPLLYLFASGNAFFIGTIILIFGVAASFVLPSVLGRTLIRFFAILGWMAIVLSAKSMWTWYFYLWFLSLLFWLILLSVESTSQKKVTRVVSLVVLSMTILGAASQLQFYLDPEGVDGEYETLYVIGDSISAGITQGETLWTDVLKGEHSVDVVNFSVAGATLSSALPLAMKIPPGKNALILLEIGGNDLLNRADEKKFAKDLDLLLQIATKSQHEAYMFELPKTPLLTDYGTIQRQIAKQHDVRIIPKRYFAKVLSGKGNTLDGLHLSNKGHREMAEVVWKFLGPSLKSI